MRRPAGEPGIAREYLADSAAVDEPVDESGAPEVSAPLTTAQTSHQVIPNESKVLVGR